MHKLSHTRDCRVHLENHTFAHTITHRAPFCTYTYTGFKGHRPVFTSCLHHAQLGCERMHSRQEEAGWQDPRRDGSGSLHSVAFSGDETLASNSLSPLLRTSRKTRSMDKATMACNRI